MANSTELNTPTLWVNKYLQAMIAKEPINFIDQIGTDTITLSTGEAGLGVPFFPSTPSSIDDITEQWVVIDDVRYPYAGVMATYDRLIRLNKKSFPHIKTEQVMYYFYATQEDVTIQMVQTQEKVLRFLDRGDESAQEVNDWCSNRRVNLGTQNNLNLVDNIFYFHNFRVYQLEETRDIIDFGTARTFGGNKIIVEYEYHQTDKNTNFANWKPEPKPDTKIII
jgi:hypothetical protein